MKSCILFSIIVLILFSCNNNYEKKITIDSITFAVFTNKCAENRYNIYLTLNNQSITKFNNCSLLIEKTNCLINSKYPNKDETIFYPIKNNSIFIEQFFSTSMANMLQNFQCAFSLPNKLVVANNKKYCEITIANNCKYIFYLNGRKITQNSSEFSDDFINKIEFVTPKE